MRRKFILGVIAIVILGGVLAVVWTVLDWPPPRLILKYGLPPTGGPTGRRKTVEGIEFVELSAGYFRMGSTYLVDAGLADAPTDGLIERLRSVIDAESGSVGWVCSELPLKWVEVRKPFWIAATETTNAQFRRCFSDFSWPEGESSRHPVSRISIEQINEFCEWLGTKSQHNARLPREVEWEYACRAGSPDLWHFGNSDGQLREYDWFTLNSGDTEPPGGGVAPEINFASQARNCRKHEVGGLRANAWGIHDMHGNLWELCLDKWTPSLQEHAPCLPIERDSLGGKRTLRGGAYHLDAIDCRSARRLKAWVIRSPFVGFRLVLTRTGT